MKLTKHQIEVLTQAAAHERGNLQRYLVAQPTLDILKNAGAIARVHDLDGEGRATAHQRIKEETATALGLLEGGDWKGALARLTVANEHELACERLVYRITEQGRAMLRAALPVDVNTPPVRP